jgi:hypothetical protein
MAILQVGYGIGAAALSWGRESEPIPAAPEAPRPQPPPTPPPVAAPAPKTEPPAERAPHLEVYAKAVERVRAPDYDSLVRFAAQAARCEGALLATPDGLLVASVSGGGLDPARVAAVLPELLRDLGKLSAPADGSRTLIHAAFGGHELLAGPGKRLVGCLLGPEPAARETAEVVLPALLARADGLWVNLQLLGAEGLPSATASDSPAEENAL